jgi:putative transposase
MQQHLPEYQPLALCEALSVSRGGLASLQAQGFIVGVRTVGRVMRSLGLRAKSSRKFKCTTDSNHKYGTSPKLLNRHFMVIRPNQVWWVILLTFVPTKVCYIWWSCLIYLAVNWWAGR